MTRNTETNEDKAGNHFGKVVRDNAISRKTTK